MTMREMAEELGLQIAELARLDEPRWVGDCHVLLLPAGMDDAEVDYLVSVALERMTLAGLN